MGILILFLVVFFGTRFLSRAPKRFDKIKARRENMTPLEIFENEIARILADPKSAKTALPKLVRNLLETYSKIPQIESKTLSEIADILPIEYNPLFHILEELEYSPTKEFSQKYLEDIISRLRPLAEKFLI